MRWLVLMLFSLWAAVARADVAPDPIAAGGDLQLMKEASVRMKRERVAIKLYPSAEVVEATFVLANDGPTKSMQVGFPGKGVRTKEYQEHRPLESFSATVDGTSVAVRENVVHHSFKTPVGERGYDETWHVFDVNLAKGKDVVVVVRYGVHTLSDWNDENKARAAYILETGRPWKGGIDEAIIEITAMSGVDPAGIDMTPTLPKNAARTKDGIKLTYAKLEPRQSDNLLISYRVDPTAKTREPDWSALVPKL